MIMKKYFLLLTLVFLVACKKETVEKPENLIPRDKMKDIIYDLSLLQAIKGVNQAVLDSNQIDATTYVYKKYKVDSLQFAKSDQYYAIENVQNYKKMYEEINDRVRKEKTHADSLLAKENVTKELPK